jgi:hypothetical protein
MKRTGSVVTWHCLCQLKQRAETARDVTLKTARFQRNDTMSNMVSQVPATGCAGLACKLAAVQTLLNLEVRHVQARMRATSLPVCKHPPMSQRNAL